MKTAFVTHIPSEPLKGVSKYMNRLVLYLQRIGLPVSCVKGRKVLLDYSTQMMRNHMNGTPQSNVDLIKEAVGGLLCVELPVVGVKDETVLLDFAKPAPSGLWYKKV